MTSTHSADKIIYNQDTKKLWLYITKPFYGLVRLVTLMMEKRSLLKFMLHYELTDKDLICGYTYCWAIIYKQNTFMCVCDLLRV